MKKSILAVFVIMAVCVGFSSAQSKKRTAHRKRCVIVKRTIIKRIMKNPTNNSAAATTTASGLTYIVTKHGDGQQLKVGDNVIVNYTGMLTNGKKFDSSLDRGQPFSFPLGAGRVIKGWDEGVQKLHVGDHATFILPSTIAYGPRGAGSDIPPDATLIFIIEVVGVK